MRKIAIVLLLILVFSTGCSSEKAYITDCSQYEQWSKKTETCLHENFFSSLPSSNDVFQWGQSYLYESTQATFGDFNFVIYVELAFSDDNEYLDAISDIERKFRVTATVKGSSYYAIQFSQKNYHEYTNSEILDGMFFNFEGIIANENERTIRYLTAHVWDYYPHLFLIEELQKYAEVCS